MTPCSKAKACDARLSAQHLDAPSRGYCGSSKRLALRFRCSFDHLCYSTTVVWSLHRSSAIFSSVVRKPMSCHTALLWENLLPIKRVHLYKRPWRINGHFWMLSCARFSQIYKGFATSLHFLVYGGNVTDRSSI